MMERLEILKKIYNYGETLSSEELNQIVSYINSSIDAINAVIDKNNSINAGHCEIRYKNSAQLPEAPESGSDGTTNGWSDTYAFPDTNNGEITWMTISFINGEGVYGNWSTPVCITWGSVQGRLGQQGDPGIKGPFKSRVFKRQNTRPSTPTGGSYDSPVPDGWSDGVPSGLAIIWSSTCTFYGNGLSTGWSIPAPESDSTTLDIEFSPTIILPEVPQGNIPFSNHEEEGWYDPNSANFDSVGRMIWRAERKVSNGEYDGDWVITRIYGEKGEPGGVGPSGGHYEFRYNNFTPSENNLAPTKPATGSDGTTGGWSATQTDLSELEIKNGTATWMTQCYKTGTDVYGAWTNPIRITGSNGVDGTDGEEIEFIYTRNNTGVTPQTPPTNPTDDWPRHLVDGVSIGYQTVVVNNESCTWYDNPQGVTENMMWEFVSTRTKVQGVWSAYSTPVVWSKWGEKGMDGDGFEYIYKRFQTVQNWANITGDDNPANWKTNHATEFLNTREYLGPTGKLWNDDPLGIDETYKYEYVSVRLEIDGVWYDYSTPTLWSGIPGGNYEFRYTKSVNIPDTPTAGLDAPSPWSATQQSISESEFKAGYKVWMTLCFKTVENTYGTWSDPIRISGANGLDGEDGSDIEFLYARTKTSTAPTKPSKPSSGDGSYTYDGVTRTWNDEDWGVGKTTGVAATNGDTIWSDNPRGVSNEIKYEWVIVRTKPAGKNTSFEDFSSPSIWSKWGEKGMDGDGYEYIYKHFSTTQTWEANNNNPNNWAANQNREYYGPTGYEWSDDPTGVDSTNKYEYVSTRQRVDGTWLKFSPPVLWSNYAEAEAAIPGPQGKLGPMSYLAGIWDSTKTYTKTETKNPVVYYQANDSYYYLVGTPPVSSLGENPTTSSKWAQAENYNMVFTDILFVNTFAKLGSFIVNLDWLITRHGTIYDSSGTAHVINETLTWASGGTTYNQNNAYLLFDTEYPQSSKSGANNFVPNAAIDARTGESYFNKAHVTGNIKATDGIFNGIVNATLFKAGNDNGFSITTSSDSLDFNYNGNRLAFFSLRSWDATNNQLADISANPTGFYLYMTNPLDGHLITIDFTNLGFKDLNANSVIRHLRTFYNVSNAPITGTPNRPSVSEKILYYTTETVNGNTVTKWYEYSDSASELTTYSNFYEKITNASTGNNSYPYCVLYGTHANISNKYHFIGYEIYRKCQIQNGTLSLTSECMMITTLTNATDKKFVIPSSSTVTLDSSNTNYGAIMTMGENSISSISNVVPVVIATSTFTFGTNNDRVTLFKNIEENGTIGNMRYPWVGLLLE